MDSASERSLVARHARPVGRRDEAKAHRARAFGRLLQRRVRRVPAEHAVTVGWPHHRVDEPSLLVEERDSGDRRRAPDDVLHEPRACVDVELVVGEDVTDAPAHVRQLIELSDDRGRGLVDDGGLELLLCATEPGTLDVEDHEPEDHHRHDRDAKHGEGPLRPQRPSPCSTPGASQLEDQSTLGAGTLHGTTPWLYSRARARRRARPRRCGGSARRGAQDDPHHAVDRLEPSERGSEWLANESLDLRGHLRPSLGYVLTFARRLLVVPGAAGTAEPEHAPVADLALLHVVGGVVLFDRLRLALDLPFQVYAGGQDAIAKGMVLPAPPKESGVGDVRLGVDVRLFGVHRGPITGAAGVQVWAPTGEKSQWTSDGVVRARPRVMLAGELGAFVWAAQVGAMARARARSELTASAAAGVRLQRTIVVGPEVVAATTFEDAFAKTATPVEALLGAHWLIDGTARLGGGIGAGLTDGTGAPAWRALFALEWSPEIPKARRRRRDGSEIGSPRIAPSDGDHDGVADSVDACPTVAGIATSDPRTNGCPPDTDEDGIDDLADACPTVRGIATSDPLTNGCADRDRDHDGIVNELDACPDDRGAPDIDPRRNGCPAASVRGERIEQRDPIAFKGAELAAGEANEGVLTAVLSIMLKLPASQKLRIEGYTDDRGDPFANRASSAARAAAVAKWLVEHGIDRTRITSEGFGPERPIATNETEAGRAENRRLELHIEP